MGLRRPDQGQQQALRADFLAAAAQAGAAVAQIDPPLHQLPVSGGELGEAAPGRGQGPAPAKAGVAFLPGELFPRVGFIVTNRSLPNERVLAFYNDRGTAEQHIKEGKYALKWTGLSCMHFAANEVRIQLHALFTPHEATEALRLTD